MIYIQNLNSFISLHNIYTTIKKEKKLKHVKSKETHYNIKIVYK